MRISDWSSDVCSSDREFGVDQRADVELAGLEHGDDALADGGRLVEGERRLGDILDGADDQRAVIAAKLVAALAADAEDLHRLAFAGQLADPAARLAPDRKSQRLNSSQ